MKSKGIILALLLTMIISIMPVTAFATEFTDMPNNWSTASLEKAAINGLLKGNNGKIMPNDNLTRAQMAAVVNRAFGTKEKEDISSFKDVPSNSWYYDDMSKAVQMKTFMGSGNKLNPDNNITREEAFVVLARAIKLEGASESVLKKFTDYELVSQWARDGVASLISAGYVSGANGKLNPKDNITRAEFAKIMDNLIKSYIKDEGTFTTVAEGNIMVQVPNVTLKDLSVKGDLIIGDGVGDGDVTLDNITVTGRLVIRGGGVNSIRIIGNSDIQNIVIARIGGVVRVFAENGVEIGEVIVDGSDDVTIEGYMRVVIVTAADVTVNAINSDIDIATIEGENSRIIVASFSNIGTVNLDGPNTKVEVLGKVTRINTTEKAEDAFISVSSKGIVEDIVAEGKGTTIEGKGVVKAVAANADGVEVNTFNTRVTAGKGTVGVMGIDENVKAGNTIITGEVEKISSGGNSNSGSGGNDKINVDAINVTGLAKVGQTLTATFANGQNPTVTYKWQYSFDGITYNDIEGAISGTYTIAEGYVGKFIKVSVTGTGRYTGTVQSAATSSIEKANALVTAWPTVSDITYGELLTNSMITTGTSSVPGTFNFDETAILTAGNHNVDVTFTPTDTANYNPVSGTVEVIVNPKELTATASADDKVYDGTLNATGTVSLSGIVGSDTVTASGTFTFKDKNVGIKSVNVTNIELSGSDSGNYIVNTTTTTANITPKVITATPLVDNKIYDGSTTATGKVTITDSVVGDAVHVSATFAFDDKNAGIGKIVRVVTWTLTGEDAGNYTVNSTTIATADINKRQITITPDNMSKIYGSSDPALTYTITAGNLVEDESLTGTLTRDSGENAGTYSIKQGTLNNNNNSNYDLTFIDGIFTINKAPLNVKANNKSKVYGDSDPLLDYSVSGTLYNGDSYGLVTGVQLSTTNGSNATVGTHTITVSGGIADNYYIENCVPGILTVNKALLNISINNASKVYGSEEPQLSYTVSGLKYEDSESVISGIDLSTNTGSAATAGTHDIIASGGTAANYTITFSNGTLDVVKKELTIIGISGINKVYDGIASANASGTPALSGLVYNDQVTVGGSPIYTFASLDANEDIMINTAGFVHIGVRASNYTLTQPTLSADITPATPVKVTMPTSLKTLTYGASLTEAEITGGYFTFKDANGVTKGVEGAFEYAEGDFIPPAGNYGAFVIFTPTSSNFATVTPDAKVNVTVNPRAITITADNISKVYGTTDPALTWKIMQGVLLNGDSFNGTLTRESGENVNVKGYAINKGTLANQNYIISVVPGKFTITPATAKLDTTPTTSPIIFGQPLSNSNLTGGLVKYGEEIVIGTFSFVNPDDSPTSIGIYHYADVKFTASSNNYNSLSEFSVDVVVNPIEYYSNTINNYRIDVNNGTSKETALNTLTLTYPTVTITGKQNQTANATITWSLSDYNGSTAGVYTAKGVVNMPYGWTSDVIKISGTIVVRSSTSTGEQTGVYNAHTYKFIPSPGITWQNAKAAAESMFDTETGERGYLATITSAEENGFVASTLNGEGWLGGSDEGNEDTWLWVTGPEAGESIASYYSNYASGEPNNWGGDEDYLHMYYGGKWNDYKENNSQISGYVVEFGGMAVNNFANTSASTTDTTVTVTWTQPAGAIGVKIQQSLAGANNWTDSNTGVIQVDSTTATVTGLTGATAYDFRLVVVGGANAGKSNVVRITTDATLVTAIAEISGSAIVGFELSAGAITPSNATVEYQWKICDTAGGIYNDIVGATTNTYTPVESDAKKFIKVVTTGTGSYAGEVTSAAIEVRNVTNSAPTTPIITRTPSGSVLVTTPITITALSTDAEGDAINYVWTGKLADGSTYPLGKNVVTVKAVDSRGSESAEAAIVFFVTDSSGGGVLLTGPNSRIYENGLEGATITHYTFNVPSVSGHSGADYAEVKGLNVNNQIWEQIEKIQVSNGVSLTKNLTPGVYSRLEFFYYASHCMYNKSNITYTVDYSFENFPSDAPTEATPVASNVTVAGSNTVGSTLTGAYIYSDVNGDLEGYVDPSYNVISTSTYQWYRADDISGTNKTAITSATTKTYTVTSSDNGKYLFFTVTPLAVTGTTGTTTGNMAQSNALYIGTVEDIAAGITTIQAPTSDATSLTLPTGAGVYTVAIKSSNNEGVIAINGTIIPPNEDTTVDLVLTVTRTSDNTTADTVSISVVVPAKTIVVIQSTNVSLKSIVVAGEFASVDGTDGTVYNVELPEETVLANLTASDVVAIATDNKAAVSDAISNDGGATWTIEVTAEDGETKATYTVNETVETEASVILSTNVSLESIVVAGEFATVDGTVYNVELPTGTVLTDLLARDVVAIATDDKATVAEATTTNGGAIWTIVVTAEDGIIEATYTVNVTVDQTVVPPETVVVTGIIVKGEADADTILLNETLLMSAEVSPIGATNQIVTWSVEAGSGTASISSNGLLTALTDGTVTVVATADDGTGVVGTKEITIINE